MNTAPNPQQALVFANDARPRDHSSGEVGFAAHQRRGVIELVEQELAH